MIRCLFEFKGLLSLVLLSLFLQTQPAFAAGSKLVILGTGNETRPDTEVNKENAISDRIAGEPTETIVVTLSDEQVRHLIEALTKQPKQGAAIKAEEKVGGLAGLIFLLDDAFRVGDYIETAGTKGMVDHISLRSLRLRHPRGMVNTIPFGDIGIVTNMSRDYIITKLDFRVRYDTDVESVRKIIKKKVYEPIMQNEELAPKLLDKIKSQGVRQMDDSAMIMRVKYKTAPGQQFEIRKEVYRLMQEAFAEEGIEFAHRNVTVYIPSDTDETESSEEQDEGAMTTGTSDKKLDREGRCSCCHCSDAGGRGY